MLQELAGNVSSFCQQLQQLGVRSIKNQMTQARVVRMQVSTDGSSKPGPSESWRKIDTKMLLPEQKLKYLYRHVGTYEINACKVESLHYFFM